MSAEFWIEALKQVPALAVVSVAFVLAATRMLKSIQTLTELSQKNTVAFLGHIADRDSRDGRIKGEHEATQQKRDTALRDLGDNCHAFQERQTTRVATSLDRNGEALGRNTVVLEQVERTLEDIDRRLPVLRRVLPEGG